MVGRAADSRRQQISVGPDTDMLDPDGIYHGRDACDKFFGRVRKCVHTPTMPPASATTLACSLLIRAAALAPAVGSRPRGRRDSVRNEDAAQCRPDSHGCACRCRRTWPSPVPLEHQARPCRNHAGDISAALPAAAAKRKLRRENLRLVFEPLMSHPPSHCDA